VFLRVNGFFVCVFCVWPSCVSLCVLAILAAEIWQLASLAQQADNARRVAWLDGFHGVRCRRRFAVRQLAAAFSGQLAARAAIGVAWGVKIRASSWDQSGSKLAHSKALRAFS